MTRYARCLYGRQALANKRIDAPLDECNRGAIMTPVEDQVVRVVPLRPTYLPRERVSRGRGRPSPSTYRGESAGQGRVRGDLRESATVIRAACLLA